MEKGWSLEEKEMESVVLLMDVTMCNTPTSHIRPLKIETTQRLMTSRSLSLSSRSIWYVKEEIMAAPRHPAAVAWRESLLETACLMENWLLLRVGPVKQRIMRPRWWV